MAVMRLRSARVHPCEDGEGGRPGVLPTWGQGDLPWPAAGAMKTQTSGLGERGNGDLSK